MLKIGIINNKLYSCIVFWIFLILCNVFNTKYILDDYSNQINLTILQKAIRDDHIENPEFLG